MRNSRAHDKVNEQNDFYKPVVNMNKTQWRCIRGEAPAGHVNPSARPWPTCTYLPRRHWGSARRPRNGLTFHFSTVHRRRLSVTADGGKGRETKRSSKRSMDPRRRTLHHSLAAPPTHRRAGAKCRCLFRTQRSLWASRQMKTKDAAAQWRGRALAGVKEFNRATS